MTEAKEKPNFEQSLARLEQLVREMEGGQLSLEKMMSHFEEGMALVKTCGDKLNEVEAKIEMLVKQGGKIVSQPLPENDQP
jgi:exodeoxyribonuclease VII small subunit